MSADGNTDTSLLPAASTNQVPNENRARRSPRLGTDFILLDSAGGTSSVVLSTNSPWTATADSAFLHLVSGSASGEGSSVVYFSYDAFTGPGTRTGTLTIAGLTLTALQADPSYIAPDTTTALLSETLDHPTGVAVDSAGNVYVADSLHNAIKKWNRSTQQVTTLVSENLNHPTGVAVDAEGNVYIADCFNNAIKQWNPSTRQVTTLASEGLNRPSGVAVDADGNVYIADSSDDAIKKWNAATQWVTTLVSAGLNHPGGVAVDAAGNIYIADSLNNTIKLWNTSTHEVTPLLSSGLNNPTGVAADGSGDVYVADSVNNTIKRWKAATKQVILLTSAGLNNPLAVAVDGEGSVFIADTSNNAVKELPKAFVGPVSLSAPASSGSGSLLPVLPTTTSAATLLAPTSDQSWLTVGPPENGIVGFSFSANTTTSARTANLAVMGRRIVVTQAGLASQSITFAPQADRSLGAASFLLSATATSGLTVTFTSSTPAVCTVSGSVVTLRGVGPCSIEASQPGGAHYSAAPPIIRSFQVTPAEQNISSGRKLAHINDAVQALLTCNTPTASTFAESFGDAGGGACGFNSNTGCNWPWHLAGTGATIVPSPGVPAANAACANSLQMVTGTASNYLSIAGPTPTIPAGTTTDTTIYIYPMATSLGAGNVQSLYVQSPSADGNNFPCRIDWHATTLGAVAVHGQGTTASADTALLSLNAWHTIALHCAAGTGNSYVALDGGTPQTFTAQADPWNFQAVGAIVGSKQSISYAIGYLTVSSSVVAGNPPLAYVNFGSQTTGSVLTSAMLNASTTCGNGSWVAQASGTPATAETISSAASLPMLGSLSACGGNYSDPVGSPLLKFDLSQTIAEYAQYTWHSYSPSASIGLWFETTVPTTDTGYYSGWDITNFFGTDFAAMMNHTGQIYLETEANPNGPPDVGTAFNYTPNTPYFIALQFNEYQAPGTYHTLQIYDAGCNLLSTQQKLSASTNPGPPAFWDAGRLGDLGTPSSVWYANNAVLDYVTGNMVPCRQRLSQVITFAPLPDEPLGSAPFTVDATSSSSLPVSLASVTPTVCTVSGTAVTVLAVGNCTIEATQAGDPNYAPAALVSQSFQVTKQTQTITFGPLADQVFGSAAFTLSASATSGLTVLFDSQTSAVCTVLGTAVTLLSGGTCTIQASQPGDANFAAAAPIIQSFEVLLTAPVVLAPLSGVTVTSPTPTFAWSVVAGNAGYRILISTDPSALPADPTAAACAGCAVGATTAGATYTPGVALNEGTTYYWEVQALATPGGRNGPWSGVSRFATPTADFSLSVSPNSLTLSAGSSRTATLTLTPTSNFSATPTFTCTPSSTLSGVTCSLGTFSNNTATITVAASASAIVHPWLPLGPRFGAWWIALAAMIWFAIIGSLRGWNLRALGAGGGGRRFRSSSLIFGLRSLALAAIFAALLLANLGCGGGDALIVDPPPTTKSGTVTITGVSTGISHSTTISVSVH